MDTSENFLLVLREVPYHPNSVLPSLTDKFEKPSIIKVTKKEELRGFKTPPLLNDKYLVIFETLKLLQDNFTFVNYNIMLPVLLIENKAQLDDALLYMDEANIHYKLYQNEFTKTDAINMINRIATTVVSESFAKAIIRQVGLSPMRIMIAMDVCEQMGYKQSVIDKYIDKHVYLDRRKLISCLLGVSQKKTDKKLSALYLQINRHWYKYVQASLVEEVDVILQVFKDKISGNLRKENFFNYLDSSKLSRAQVMFASNLFEHVSVATVFALREFLKTAKLVEVVLKLE